VTLGCPLLSASPVNTSQWSVVLGRLQQNGSNLFEVTLGVISITISNLTGNNVAVLALSGSPMISDYIQPLCLDTGVVDFLNNADCWLAGWGQGEGGGEFPHPIPHHSRRGIHPHSRCIHNTMVLILLVHLGHRHQSTVKLFEYIKMHTLHKHAFASHSVYTPNY